MNRATRSQAIALTVFCLTLNGTAIGNDLNDSITIDTPVSDNVNVDKNTRFRVMDAKAKAKRKGGKIITNSGQNNGLGNINIGAGANLKGTTIINLSNNKNGTAIAE